MTEVFYSYEVVRRARPRRRICLNYRSGCAA